MNGRLQDRSHRYSGQGKDHMCNTLVQHTMLGWQKPKVFHSLYKTMVCRCTSTPGETTKRMRRCAASRARPRRCHHACGWPTGSSGTLTAGVDRVTGTRSENHVRAACGEAAGSSQTLNPGSLRAWYHASDLDIFSISVRRCVAVLLTLCCGFWCGGCHVAVRPLTIIFCGNCRHDKHLHNMFSTL